MWYGNKRFGRDSENKTPSCLPAGPYLTRTLFCVPMQISQEPCACLPVQISQELCTECRSKSHRNFVLSTDPNIQIQIPIQISQELCACVQVQISQALCAPCRYISHRNFVLSTGPDLTGTLRFIAVQTCVQVQLHRIHDVEQIRTTYKLQHPHVGYFRYRKKMKKMCETATNDIQWLWNIKHLVMAEVVHGSVENRNHGANLPKHVSKVIRMVLSEANAICQGNECLSYHSALVK